MLVHFLSRFRTLLVTTCSPIDNYQRSDNKIIPFKVIPQIRCPLKNANLAGIPSKFSSKGSTTTSLQHLVICCYIKLFLKKSSTSFCPVLSSQPSPTEPPNEALIDSQAPYSHRLSLCRNATASLNQKLTCNFLLQSP